MTVLVNLAIDAIVKIDNEKIGKTSAANPGLPLYVAGKIPKFTAKIC